jgi:hypothetical protein
MPENTTTHFALPYPSGTGAVKLGASDIEELAQKLDGVLFAGEGARLTLVAHGAGVKAKPGELLEMTATATVKTPLQAANAIFGVICAGGETTIKTEGGGIRGDFVGAAPTETIKLTLYQHVILQSDGENWYIIAGEPKREQTYVLVTPSKAEWEAGVVINTTRPVLATIYSLAEFSNVSVGGKTIAPFVAKRSELTVQVNPGQALKCEPFEAEPVNLRYLLL